MELNDQQFRQKALFDSDEYAIEHPGQMRRGAWQGQDEIMWHATDPGRLGGGSRRDDLRTQWRTDAPESHAGTLSSADQRVSGSPAAIVWPLRPSSRRLDNTPDSPEVDVLANLAANPSYTTDSGIDVADELSNDPHHGPIIEDIRRGVENEWDIQALEDRESLVDEYVERVTPSYQEGLYYKNIAEDKGSTSVVAPSENLHTHYDDVEEAKEAGHTVQPVVRAEADLARRSPLRLKDVVSEQQITPEIVGNVGGRVGQMGRSNRQSPYNLTPFRNIPYGEAQIMPTSVYPDVDDYKVGASEHKRLRDEHSPGSPAFDALSKEERDRWNHQVTDSRGLALKGKWDIERGVEEFWGQNYRAP